MNKAVRIKTGHVTVANIDADIAALIQNFAVQTDMGANKAAWNCNLIVGRHASVRIPLSAKARGQGYIGLSVFLKGMTFGMVDYFLDTFMATTNEYGLITIKSYNETNAAKYYQGVMQKPDFQNTKQNEIGYEDVLWPILKGVEIT